MAEFIYRRLDGYERNISVLLARLRESFPGEEQLLEDLGNLHEIVRQQRERCEIARNLRISESTLRRRRRSFQGPVV